MNSNLQPAYDPHSSALDLHGLEDLLAGEEQKAESAWPDLLIREEQTPEIADLTPPDSQPEADETSMIIELLSQLCSLTEVLNSAQSRLSAALGRLVTLETTVAIQSEKVEAFPHLQTQAAKVPGLEQQVHFLAKQVHTLEQENQYLRQPWWRRLWAELR